MTLKDLQRLKEQGLIKGWTDDTKSPEKYSHKTGKNMSTRKGDKIKGWIGKNLWAFCRANGLHLETEVCFHPERKWRADWMITGKGLQVAVEYEGIVARKSRHTSLTGYSADTEKYTEMAKAGIICIRLTALNYKDLNRHLEEILNKLPVK